MTRVLIIRGVIASIFVAALMIASQPASSWEFNGLWVGTIKHISGSEIQVYSTEHRNNLLFVIPPGFQHVTSADGTHHYKVSDLKVGSLVRVHVNMPYDFGYYYGTVIGATYVTRIDLLNGVAYHHTIQKALRATLPSPSPRPEPTSPPPVPIIFVSPSP